MRWVPVEVAVAENHTITDVDPRSREWTPPQGGDPVTFYTIKLDTHGDQEVSIGLKKGEPKVGEQLFGVVEETPRGLKFKKVNKNYESGGGGGSFRKDDPDQRRSIERQVSAKIAADLIVADKAGLDQFRTLVDRIHSAIEGGQ
jgi:hypothetical protein